MGAGLEPPAPDEVMKREVHHPGWATQIGWRPGVHELVQFRWSFASPVSRHVLFVNRCANMSGEGVIVSSPKKSDQTLGEPELTGSTKYSRVDQLLASLMARSVGPS